MIQFCLDRWFSLRDPTMMTVRMDSPSGPSWPPTPGLSTREASGRWRLLSFMVQLSQVTSWTGRCSCTAPRTRPTPTFQYLIPTASWRWWRRLTRVERKCNQPTTSIERLIGPTKFICEALLNVSPPNSVLSEFFWKQLNNNRRETYQLTLPLLIGNFWLFIWTFSYCTKLHQEEASSHKFSLISNSYFIFL